MFQVIFFSKSFSLQDFSGDQWEVAFFFSHSFFHSFFFSFILSIITARKRSLGQGNMFTGVCLSTGGCLLAGGLVLQGVHALGGGLVLAGVPAPGRSGPRGVPAPGGLVPGGVWSWGDAWWRPPGRLLLRAARILLECIFVPFFILSFLHSFFNSFILSIFLPLFYLPTHYSISRSSSLSLSKHGNTELTQQLGFVYIVPKAKMKSLPDVFIENPI